MPADLPPTPPTLLAPISLKGRWQRDWRLGTELVDAAVLTFSPDGVFVAGRRTNPLRGVLWLAFRYGWTLLSLATFLSVILTSIGLTWRACVASPAAAGGCSGTWLWLGPLVAVPGLLIAGWIARAIVRRFLEPTAYDTIPWANVSAVATDGVGIDLVATGRFGAFRARLAPRRSRELGPLLGLIATRALPGSRGGESGRLIRSRWLDWGAGLTVAGLLVGGAIQAEPWLTGAAVAVDRPEEAVPSAMTARGLDARQERACAGSASTAGVTAWREGDDLAWKVQGDPGGVLALLRMKGGDSRYDVVERTDPAAGRRPGFFQASDEAAVVALLAADSAVGPLVASGRVEDLAVASCAGLVRDVALARPSIPAEGLSAARDGDDLLVEAPALAEPGRLLAVRRRAGTRGELFRWCEVAALGDDLRTVVAGTTGARFPGFFQSDADEALVYFVPTDRYEAARRLAVGGAVQRCLDPESLLAAGVATLRAEVEADGRHTLLRWRTGVRAHAAPMFPPGAAAAARPAGAGPGGAPLRAELSPIPDASSAFDQAFFDAVDWTAVFDTVNFGRDLGALEQLRAGVAASGGQGAGVYALTRVGEAFLDRFPAEPIRYAARIRVGKAWMDAPDALHLQGESAETWRIVGRFVLVDIGRHLEDDLTAGRLGLIAATPVMVELSRYGVPIDIPPSTTHKVLRAWLTGDFGYLIDRFLKKLAEVSGQTAGFGDTDYRLDQSVSIGKAARMSRLLQGGEVIGWVAQYDARAVRARWVLGSRVPSNALLAMSAAYSESDGSMAGIALSAGKVQNWLWKPEMGGMVVVGSDGGVQLLDMRRGGRLGARFLRPGGSLVDFSTLVRTVQQDGGAAFQTYLLAGDGAIRLNPDRSSQELRERRLLALARYGSNTIVCVVDLPRGLVRQGYTLYQAAEVAVNALRTPETRGGPGLEVLAVANLDTGAKDFLVARDAAGRTVRETRPNGVVPTNLLVITPG